MDRGPDVPRLTAAPEQPLAAARLLRSVLQRGRWERRVTLLLSARVGEGGACGVCVRARAAQRLR
eukprot:2098551-Prymnesium_polylepis.1